MTICDAKMKPSHAPSLPLSSTHFGYTRRYVGIRKAVQLIWRGLRQYIYHCYDGICWKWSASASSSPSCWHRCCWILTRNLFILVPSDFITRWSHNMTLVHCRPSSLPRVSVSTLPLKTWSPRLPSYDSPRFQTLITWPCTFRETLHVFTTN